MTELRCHRCGASAGTDPVSVRAVCAGCGAFLHCCRNCDFWEPGRNNDCREPNAGRVADKEAGNFCDHFRPSSRPVTAAPPSDARAKLDALFRKKPS